jgi:DNA-binding transcriptional regulator YiaG
MRRNTKTDIAFDGEELIRRLEGFAKHVRGEKPLTLRTTRMALPPPEKPLKPSEVTALRGKLGVSQAVFAALLNVPKPTAISWESGARQPSGAALKLLRLATRHPKLLAA